jgi:hypothetical protein
MNRGPYDATRLLKWYPLSWRIRYGDEFVAYVEDTLDGARPTPGFLFSVAAGALRERGHQSGLVGQRSTPAAQSRAGSLLVLCAWSAFIFAGASFSKLSEHFARAMPVGSASPARIGFDIVAACGALGMILVLVGAIVALPSFAAFLRSGGWTTTRRPLLTALAISVLALGTLFPLAQWAHHLTGAQRNGGDGTYSLAFVAWALVIALALGSGVRAAVRCVASMEISPRVLRVEARLAMALSFLMVAMTAGAVLWWAEVASNAPWFLQGASYGTSSSPLTLNLLFTLALMLCAACAGALGVRRIAHSSRPA